MIKNILMPLCIFISVSILLFSGCSPYQSADETTREYSIIATSALPPDKCFQHDCDTSLSLPEGKAYFFGGDSGTLQIAVPTEFDGSFKVEVSSEESYVLYTLFEVEDERFVVLKKAITNPSGEVGEVDAYSTAQVIIWEQLNLVHGSGFSAFDAHQTPEYWSFDPETLVFPVEKIINLQPSDTLLDAVNRALENCLDPKEDCAVIRAARADFPRDFKIPSSPKPRPVTFPTSPQVYTLSLVSDPLEGGPLTGGGKYEAGKEIVVEAQENEGYSFLHWKDEDDNILSKNMSHTFIMPAKDVNLRATFEEKVVNLPTYTLVTGSYPEAGGVSSGEGEYEAGAKVTVTATSHEGWEFVKWTDDCGNEVSRSASFSYTMPAEDTTLIANFITMEPNVINIGYSHTSTEGIGDALYSYSILYIHGVVMDDLEKGDTITLIITRSKWAPGTIESQVEHLSEEQASNLEALAMALNASVVYDTDPHYGGYEISTDGMHGEDLKIRTLKTSGALLSLEVFTITR